jgi:hypothetical protein
VHCRPTQNIKLNKHQITKRETTKEIIHTTIYERNALLPVILTVLLSACGDDSKVMAMAILATTRIG